MANDFSGDSSVKALWRFESGALAVDSIGGNTLSLKNTPVVDTTDVQEGSGCALFSHASDQGLYISDASLDAGFPLKSGDSVKKISFCVWHKAVSHPDSPIFAKWTIDGGSTNLSIFFSHDGTGSFTLGWGTGTSADWSLYRFKAVNDNQWYHIAVVIDGVAKTAHIRIWDGTTTSNYDHTYGAELSAASGTLYIGNTVYNNNGLDGRLDELAVFNRLLTDTEIDAIRGGTFSAVATRDLTTTCAVVSTSSAPLVTVTRPLTTSVAVASAIPDFALWKNSTTPYSYEHPNTPANDPTCVALWRFETGDSIRDYIGTNDLSFLPADQNPSTFSTYMEGVSAQAFIAANSQYLSRADADLSADFPLKSTGSQVGNISVWFYANYLGGFAQVILAKGDTADGLLIGNTQGHLDIFWMGQRWLGLSGLTAGRWYHLSVNIDGPNKTLGIRLWDDTDKIVILGQKNFTNTLTGNSSAFTVGGPGSFWDGAIDELIMWDRKLTIAEMELVQEQYFHGDVNAESNNFTSDPYCQAVWDFEESAPTADSSSKGNDIVTDNLFASNGLVGAGTGGKYGDGYGQITGAYISDANLANSFPFKLNDTIKKATVCAWITPYFTYPGGVIFSKRGLSENNSFDIIQDTNSPYNLKIRWGDGTNLTTYDTGITLDHGYSYHISVEIDGINKTIYAEVLNNFTGVLYTYSATPSTQATVSAQSLGIGNIGDAWNLSFSGFIDQVVVWNRLLSVSDLAAVRAGTFVSHLVATAIAVQSQISDINLIVQRSNLTTSTAVISTVGAPILAIDRHLAMAASVVSAAPDVDLSIIILGDLTTVCTVASAISAPLLKITRNLSSAPAVVTAIPNPLLAILRDLQSSVEVESVTSSTLLAVLRKLASTVDMVSTISTPNLLVLRHLATLAVLMSATSNIYLDRFLPNTAHIVVHLQIPDVVLNVARPLNTLAAVQSQIPNITLRVWRDLVTAILVQSAASAPVVDTHNYLFTAIEVVTGGFGSIDILRPLATAIAAQTDTSDISLIQNAIWDLVTSIVVHTQTPDNVELTLTLYESLLAKAKRYYEPIDVADLESLALQWLPPEEERELHLPGDQFNDHEFQ